MFILAFGVDFKWEFKANISWEAGFPVVKGEGGLGGSGGSPSLSKKLACPPKSPTVLP